jgi:hypothetical protein
MRVSPRIQWLDAAYGLVVEDTGLLLARRRTLAPGPAVRLNPAWKTEVLELRREKLRALAGIWRRR